MLFSTLIACLIACVPAAVLGHVAAFAKGMYCQNGLQFEYIYGTSTAANPLWMMHRNDWWMHGKCINFPPPTGEFLDLPAGGSFNVEIANNKAFTTMNRLANKTSNWADGKLHKELESVDVSRRIGTTPCISNPNIHTVSQTTAAGTAFAIAYKSDIKAVTLKDLTVFTVKYHSPWKRVTTYQVPKNMPKCPEGGCICAWGWIPNGCGVANMYMVPYRCRVTGARADAPKLATAQVPTWCEEDSARCTTGAKQFMVWNQLDGHNIKFARNFTQVDGQHPFPGYNMKMGFKDGPQDDIFLKSASSSAPAAVPTNTPDNEHNDSPATATVTQFHTVTHTATATATVTETQVVETQFIHTGAAEHYATDTEAGDLIGISCRRVHTLRRRGKVCGSSRYHRC